MSAAAHLAHSRAIKALREAYTSEEMQALHERNEQRAREAREQMGRLWVLHPDNHVRARTVERGVLRIGR